MFKKLFEWFSNDLAIDLGTAKTLKYEENYRTHTMIGTPHYMAP